MIAAIRRNMILLHAKTFFLPSQHFDSSLFFAVCLFTTFIRKTSAATNRQNSHMRIYFSMFANTAEKVENMKDINEAIKMKRKTLFSVVLQLWLQYENE
jgi:hypothetical protein